MSRPSDSKELTLFSKPPLLITESEEEFASLSAALEQEIKPRCVVERIYVADIADLVWEILRLRRCKAAIINTAFEDALSDLLNRLMGYLNSTAPKVKSARLSSATGSGSQRPRRKFRNYSVNITSMSLPSKRKQSEACPKSSRRSTGR